MSVRTMNGTREVQRITNLLKHGRRQLENCNRNGSLTADSTTYYLLKDRTTVLPFRLWHQKDRPEYIMAGSKLGVENYRKAISRDAD